MPWSELETASEASRRQYVELDQTGDFLEWEVEQPGQGLVIRYTISDAEWGNGIDATLGLYVNGERIRELAMTSRFAWQYYPEPNDTTEPSNVPSARLRMRFDDLRVFLPSPLIQGDRLRLQKDEQNRSVYGIDRVEVESISPVVLPPEDALDVTKSAFSAAPDDEEDDWPAFRDGVAAAKAQGKVLYLPSGRYVLDRQWQLDCG